MQELLTKLGIDWKLLVAQMINFLVLLAILYKLLYKPVLKMLDDRREKIDKSLKQAEEIEKNLFESEGQKNKIISEARNEAGQIVAEAKQLAEKLKVDLTNQARIEAANIADKNKKALEQEKEAMLKEIKEEVADMIVIATEKLLKEKLNGAVDKSSIEKGLEEING